MKKLYLASKSLPKLPLSALIFYVVVVLLWQLEWIPNPASILLFLESLYDSYGLLGLFIACLLEGTVYLCLYFPGSFIVVLAVILSDGSFSDFFAIALTTSVALSIAAWFDHTIGKLLASRNKTEKNKELKHSAKFSKGLLISMLHPALIAFYFFNTGIKKESPWKIFLIPCFIMPYGIALSYLFYQFKDSIRSAIENPLVMIGIIMAWLVTSMLLERKSQLKKVI